MIYTPIQRSGQRFLAGPKFNDLRLSRRFEEMLDRMAECQGNVVNQISINEPESRGYYRFLSNERVSHSEMLEQISHIDSSVVASRSLVVVGDTTEISLKSQLSHIKDADRIGVLSDNKTRGFLAHANLVLDGQAGHILGLSDLLLWSRPISTASRSDRTRSRKTRPWAEKESYKWWLGMSHSQSVLAPAREMLFVFDTEADFANLWEEPLPDKVDLLIRVQNYDRQMADLPKSLFEYLQTVEFCGQYALEVSSLSRRNYSKNKPQTRKGRKTQVEFRYSPVKLKLRKRKPTTTDLYAIEAREVADQVPEGERPIQWYLLTTRTIDSPKQARQLIQYYEWRWQIEQLFRLLKRKGFAIEQSELTTFDAILRQTILSFGAAIRVMQLLRARDQAHGQLTNDVFSEQEQQCLKILNQKYQGRTVKQQNPFAQKQLAWASWIIARLGGWKGYKSQHPPGPITFKRGWEKFNTYFDAWILFKQ
jgi:hypothetical protein